MAAAEDAFVSSWSVRRTTLRWALPSGTWSYFTGGSGRWIGLTTTSGGLKSKANLLRCCVNYFSFVLLIS